MLVSKALQFAKDAHSGQLRRFTKEPYIYHPIRVTSELMKLSHVDDHLLAAGLLHDVVEDCDIKIGEVEQFFGAQVAQYVFEVTNQYTKEQYSSLNRLERKQLEHQRLSGVSVEAQQIKLCDRLDNLRDLKEDTTKFKEVYIAESFLLLDAIGEAYPSLKENIKSILDNLCWEIK